MIIKIRACVVATVLLMGLAMVACAPPYEPPLCAGFKEVVVEGTSIKLEWHTDFFEVVITRYVYKEGLGGDREKEWAGKFENETTVYYDSYNLVRGYYYQYDIIGNEPGEGASSRPVLYEPVYE
jgi:hypothetical protein